MLTPLAFDPGHPFPYISNRSKNFAVVVKGDGRTRFARVKVPDVLPRFVPIPPLLSGKRGLTFALLEDVIRLNLADAARPGSDFWPGEYQKTYVHAQRSYQGVLDALRSGRIFAVAGDLITELDVEAKTGRRTAGIGETLAADKGQPITLKMTFRDPDAKNTHGDNPRVSRVDLIIGEVHGASEDANVDRNPTTRVLARFVDKQWVRDGDTYTITTTLPKTDRDFYVRIRGTNTQDAEPPMDTIGESPWSDLWFYSNPIFVEFAAR